MKLFNNLLKNVSWVLIVWCLSGSALAQPSDGLVHHFPFSLNLTNSANTHTLTGSGSFTNDRFNASNSAYNLPNDNTTLTSSTINMPAGGSDRTIAFWFKVAHVYKEFFLFGHGVAGAGYAISYNTSSGLLFIGNGSSSKNIYIDRIYEWMHLAVSYNNSTFAHDIYINGTYHSSISFNISSSAATPLKIGEHLDGYSKGANFSIDELYIYNRALSATEIQSIYNRKCQPDPKVTSTQTNVCPGKNVELTFDKFVSVFNSTGTRVSTNILYTTPNLNATTTFYIIDSLGSTCYSNRVPVTITVKEALPAPVSVTDILEGSICGDSGRATLKVQENPDYTVNWYTASNGGTPIATGPVFVTPFLKSTTKYYFANEAPDKCPSKRSEEYIWIYPKYEVDFVASKTEICPGETVSFSGFEEVPYYLYKDNSWVSTGDLWSGEMPFSYQDAPTQTTTYVNTVGEWFGCMDNDTIIITVIELNPTITQSGNVLSTDEYQTYQWYKNDQIVDGATAQTLEIIESGSYKVSVTNDNGCSGMSDVENVAITSLIGRGASKVSNLYPNPASSILTIELVEAGQINILNMFGEKLDSFKVPAGLTNINVNHLSSGIYLLQTDKGESIKFTKE